MVVHKTEADEIRDAFNKILADPEAYRAQAVNFLNSIKDVEEAGVDVLISGVRMPDIDIKISSALTLGRLGVDSAEALSALRCLLEDSNNNSFVRGSAASALARLGTPGAAEILSNAIKTMGLKNEDDRTFWELSLIEFASMGGLGLPHIKIFDDLRKDFNLCEIKGGDSIILSARREFSRALEGDYRRFVAKTLYQSPRLDHFVDDSNNLIEVPEFIKSLAHHVLVFDERVSFRVSFWNRGPIQLNADVRLVVLNSLSEMRKPTVIISRDEMSEMSLFMDGDDIARSFVAKLNRSLDDFEWAVHSSPGRDNGRLDGTMNSVKFNPTATILNTNETEAYFGDGLAEVKEYLRNHPNPPAEFYNYVVAFRQDLARRMRGH